MKKIFAVVIALTLILTGCACSTTAGNTNSEMLDETLKAEFLEAIKDENAQFEDKVTNDKTGKYRVFKTTSGEIFLDHAAEYYKAYFTADDEVHFIVNPNIGTTTKMTVKDGKIQFSTHKYVDNEENDAATLHSGEYLSAFTVDPETGKADEELNDFVYDEPSESIPSTEKEDSTTPSDSNSNSTENNENSDNGNTESKPDNGNDNSKPDNNQNNNQNSNSQDKPDNNQNSGGNGNNSDNNSQSSGENTAPAHEHTWVAITTTVHHDAEYKTVHHDAEYNTVHHDAEYETQTTTIHHDAEYKTETKTVHHDAEYETQNVWVPIGDGTGLFCNACNADMTEWSDQQIYDHEYAHAKTGEASGDHTGPRGYYEQQQVLVKEAWDETVEEKVLVKEAWDETVEQQVLVKDAWDEQVLVKEAWDEQVLVKEAWDEEVITGYRCSECGETK